MSLRERKKVREKKREIEKEKKERVKMSNGFDIELTFYDKKTYLGE